MIEPHGGKLVRRIANKVDISLKIEISKERAYDVENIGVGIYSPLEGFMVQDDFISVLNRKRLSSDVPWTIPIILDISSEIIKEKRILPGDEVSLTHNNVVVGLMEIEEIYPFALKDYCKKVFGTTSQEHPGVARALKMGDVLLGGKVKFFKTVDERFSEYDLKPEITREMFDRLGWECIVGFQTRNAPHLGHEYLQKTALLSLCAHNGEKCGIFINPVVGRKKRGDFRDEVVIKAYETLIQNFYPPRTAILGIWKYEMKYAGPREAVFHAIVRKNFGCTHFIVGRDHAGVGDFYGPYEAQEIFSEFPDLGIKPLFLKNFVYCRLCGGMVNEVLCPHEHKKPISGTEIRRLIERKEIPSPEIMRPEISKTILSFSAPFL